jgi:hypothetical protein
LAAKVTFAVGVSLLLITIATWIVYNAQPQRVAWGDYLNGTQIVTLASLWVVTCGITYWTVRLWSEEVPVRYSELEIAWRAGFQKMAQQGIDVQRLPLFLVLGCHDEKSQLQLLNQCGFKPVTGLIPASSGAPIRWSITEESVLLFCNQIGLLGTIQSRIALHQPLAKSVASHVLPLDAFRMETTQNIRPNWTDSELDGIASEGSESMVAQGDFDKSYVPPMAANLRGSVHTGAAVTAEQRLVRRKSELESLADDTTRRLDETEELIAKFENRSGFPFESSVLAGNPHAEILSSNEQVECQAMLEDFCRRLRGSRRATAPINGILAWIDTPQLMDSANCSTKLGESLRKDLDELESLLGIQAPVTVVLDQMHAVPGFSELIRRLGPERASVAMLGEAFSLEKYPDSTSINQLSRNAVRTLCSAAYHHFHAPNGTGQPGNHKLFQMVAAGRGKLSRSLQPFLVQSISVADGGNRADSRADEPTLFGGVFFASSCDEPIKQGFVRGIFSRMMDQQELLNWTSRRRQAEKRYSLAILTLQCVSFLLFVLFVCQIVFRNP